MGKHEDSAYDIPRTELKQQEPETDPRTTTRLPVGPKLANAGAVAVG